MSFKSIISFIPTQIKNDYYRMHVTPISITKKIFKKYSRQLCNQKTSSHQNEASIMIKLYLPQYTAYQFVQFSTVFNSLKNNYLIPFYPFNISKKKHHSC